MGVSRLADEGALASGQAEEARGILHALERDIGDSPQEWQIAQLAASGLSNRDIGQQLYISHRTVGSHLYRIFPKLGITSRNQLHGYLQTRQAV